MAPGYGVRSAGDHLGQLDQPRPCEDAAVQDCQRLSPAGERFK